jgi:hypothetical protein
MRLPISLPIVAILLGLSASSLANDRPDDPFGNHTIERNNEVPLVETWESLRDQVLLDKAHFHSCLESDSNPDCEAVSTLMKIVEEARQNEGKALGMLNGNELRDAGLIASAQKLEHYEIAVTFPPGREIGPAASRKPVRLRALPPARLFNWTSESG